MSSDTWRQRSNVLAFGKPRLIPLLGPRFSEICSFCFKNKLTQFLKNYINQQYTTSKIKTFVLRNYNFSKFEIHQFCCEKKCRGGAPPPPPRYYAPCLQQKQLYRRLYQKRYYLKQLSSFEYVKQQLIQLCTIPVLKTRTHT